MLICTFDVQISRFNSSRMLFMQHPEYSETQVLETLAPSKEIKDLCKFYSEFE